MTVLLLTVAFFLVFPVFFFVCDSGYCNGRPNWDELASPIDVAPSKACVAVTQIDTDLQCFFECMKRMRNFYMFSRQTVTLMCFCCKDTPNVPFLGPNWKSFRARKKTNWFFLFWKPLKALTQWLAPARKKDIVTKKKDLWRIVELFFKNKVKTEVESRRGPPARVSSLV